MIKTLFTEGSIHYILCNGFNTITPIISLTLCDSLAESIKNSQSSKTGVQDLMEAIAKIKYFEEELKKNEIEGERVSKELNEMLFVKLHMQEKHGVSE